MPTTTPHERFAPFSWLAACVALCCLPYASAGQLALNEFMASNDATVADPQGDFEDWIEVYNAGDDAVDLAGYYLSDDPDDVLAFRLPAGDPLATTVPARGYLLLWADKDEDDGAAHLGFKLSGDGETITLTAPDGLTVVDQYAYGPQVADVSFGRSPDGTGDWGAFATPTPGAANLTPQGQPTTEAPVFSRRGGFYAGTVTVALSSATADAVVYYTTDGSVPDEGDATYEAPLAIDANTPLRARAYAPGRAASAPVTQTYLFDARPTFAVVAYTADPVELFDEATGMYPNFEEDIEIVVNAELYEPDGTQGFNQRFESELQGRGSAKSPQKSLALKAKKSLGAATIDYRVFPNSEATEFRSLVLRNSGQDNNTTHFRDALASSLALDVADAPQITPPRILGQDYRPTVTYVNGRYWGILNLRERTDRRYLRDKFGLEREDVDYIENEAEVKEGTIDADRSFTRFLMNNSLASEANYATAAAQLDVEQYIDYLAFNLYIDNADWPGNNVRRFRERAEGAKWRYLTFDLDFSLGLFVAGQGFNSGANTANSLARLLALNDRWPNPRYATLLPRRLLENEGWRTRFVNRLADQLNVLYTDERLGARVDAFQAAYRPEIGRHAQRWGFIRWDENVDKLRRFADGRTDVLRGHVVSEIDAVTGTAQVVVDVDDAAGGRVVFSTVTVAGAPYRGTYFTGVEIPVRAVANPGYAFAGWTGALTSANPDERLRLSGDVSLRARFVRAGTAPAAIVINEVNYNSPDELDPGDWVELYNPTASTVGLAGWTFRDSGEDAFVLPAGTAIGPGAYLVLASDAGAFASVFRDAGGAVVGDFGADPGGFGLSGKGESIGLYDGAGALVDALEYDDGAPWPEAADGDGPTLQLIDPTLDNASAASWKAAAATPGAANIATADPKRPQTITFAALPDRLTTDGAFALSASASSGLAVSFELVSGPAALTAETLTLTGAEGTVTVRATQLGDAEFEAASPVARSFAVRRPVTPPTDARYCEAAGDKPWQEWIARVELGNIDEASGKAKYTDNTGASTVLTAGGTFPIALTTGFSWESYEEHFGVWIDFDQDRVFTPGERVYGAVVRGVANGTTQARVTGTVRVPAGAPSGKTRMRVVMQRGGAPEPCGRFEWGEAEDYTVDIVADARPRLTLSACPADITLRLAPGAATATANWTAPTATTTCPGAVADVTQTEGPASGSALGLGTRTVRYRATDACGQEQSCAFAVTVLPAEAGPVTYCASRADFPWHEWLSRVRVGSFEKASGKGTYSDFTSSVLALQPGQTVPVSLTTGFSWAAASQGFRIWIDYDGDGDFAASEIAFASTLAAPPNGTPTATVTGTLSVPATAAPGRRRMRVSMRQGGLPEPCGALAFGEVEDYTVEVGTGARPMRLSGEALPEVTTAVGIYPNPASATATVTWTAAAAGDASVSDVTGRVVAAFSVAAGAGRHVLEVGALGRASTS